MNMIRSCAVAVAVILAIPSFAALSKENAAFAKGSADFLMTKEERKQWKAIATDDQARQFIDLFWARRDPTPGTRRNEYKEGVDERVKVADERFHAGNVAGSRTDRGKVFILLGSPTKIRRSSSGPVSTIQTPGSGRVTRPGGVQADSPREVWEYEQGKTPLQLGQPLVQIAFIDQYATNDWKMERTVQTDTTALFESVASSFVVQPDLTSIPDFKEETAPAAAAAEIAPAPPAATELTNEAYRAAVETARAAGQPSESLFVTYGEFITPKGEQFVPVQLYLAKSAGLAAGTEVAFFGSVEKEGGEKAAVFDEPATLSASGEGVYYARSLSLLPGKYTASFGLAKDGKPVAVTTVPLVVSGLEKDAPGISALLLTNNIFPLAEAQNPTDPFAFGGLKVVPKSDGTFKKSEDLSYFFEVRNPGVDPTTAQPNMTMRVTISGKTADGRGVKMAGAAEAVQLQELKGVPGHYAVGQAIPLATFKPGSYTMAIKVTDVALNKTYDLSGSFRVVE